MMIQMMMVMGMMMKGMIVMKLLLRVCWIKGSTCATNDLVGIIANDEYMKNKLIFQNTKTQQNSMIYQQVLTELKRRCDDRGENM